MNRNRKELLNDRTSKNIKFLRELRGLTREQIADSLKMSLSGYSKIERGIVEITVNKLEEIAHVLNVDPHYVLLFDSNELIMKDVSRFSDSLDGETIIPEDRDIWFLEQIKFLKEEISGIKKSLSGVPKEDSHR